VGSPLAHRRIPRRIGDNWLLCLLSLPRLAGPGCQTARALALVASLHPLRLRRLTLYRTDVADPRLSDLPPAA
jgi:hypothetical protein